MLTIAAIVVGAGVLGATLVAVGIAAQITAFGFAGLAAAIGLALSLLGAILSPMGLLVAAAVALGAYLIYASDAGSQALAWLAQRFAVLKDDALKSWDAIGAALASGNIALAGRLLWLTLKMEWQKGVNYLTKLWLNFKHAFLDIATRRQLRRLCTTGYDLGAMVNRSRDRALYDAALRQHGTWRAALTAAGINLANVSRRRPEHFDRETMLLWLRNRQAAGQSLVYTKVCLEHRDKALAIRRTFGSWGKAIEEASEETDKDR